MLHISSTRAVQLRRYYLPGESLSEGVSNFPKCNFRNPEVLTSTRDCVADMDLCVRCALWSGVNATRQRTLIYECSRRFLYRIVWRVINIALLWPGLPAAELRVGLGEELSRRLSGTLLSSRPRHKAPAIHRRCIGFSRTCLSVYVAFPFLLST